MTAIQYGLVVAGIAVAVLTVITATAPSSPVNTGYRFNPEHLCLADGKVWHPRNGGWCYIADKPK